MIETAQRPRGTYTVLTEGDGFKVKTIEVQPGHRLSCQKHARRSEHWLVVAGEAARLGFRPVTTFEQYGAEQTLAVAQLRSLRDA